ncbi:MAG TPA: hypothetical protein VGA15_24275 [Bradyrhizobium sp.]
MAQVTRHNPAAIHAPSGGYSMGLELGQHRRLLFVSGRLNSSLSLLAITN